MVELLRNVQSSSAKAWSGAPLSRSVLKRAQLHLRPVKSLRVHLQHRNCGSVVGVTVMQGLMARDIADGTKRGLADLPCSFRYCIGRFEQFFRLLVKQEMVVAKMRAAHVPMEVLRLEIDAARGGY